MQGQTFLHDFSFNDTCLPLGPYIGSFFGPEQVYGSGGNPPSIGIRIKQELALVATGSPKQPSAETLVRTLNARLGTQQEWLHCTRQILNILKLEASNNMEVLRQLLYWARTSLTTCRYRSTPASVLRPLVEQFADTYLNKLGIQSWTVTPLVSASTIAAAAGEVMGLYQSAGLDEDGYQQ